MTTKPDDPALQQRRIDTAAVVRDAVATAPIHDIHTHLFAPEFGDLLLSGIDDLLTYHYLVAEFFRLVDPAELSFDAFFALPKEQQAAWVWRVLFVERTPLSDAARGVVDCLRRLGADPAERDLAEHRRFFARRSRAEQLEQVLACSGVETIVMTNDPLDPQERGFWAGGASYDSRFRAALRLDRLLELEPGALELMNADGYEVDADLNERSLDEIRRFLRDWVARMKPVYVAASLGPEFRYPDSSALSKLLQECVIPIVGQELGLPVALMIGVRRQINPSLRLAGDGLGRADVSAMENLCSRFGDVRFLTTFLARENQQEVVVAARKFRNLHVFGCWWFVNVGSLTDEITRLRIELLGHGFTPQHSDARVLEQLVYKWHDARRMLSTVLVDSYTQAVDAGWNPDPDQVRREVADLLGGRGMRFLAGAVS